MKILILSTHCPAMQNRQFSEPASKRIQIKHQNWLRTAMNPYAMWLLWKTGNTAKKFFLNHIYDRRAGIQRVPILSGHSDRIHVVLLKKLIVFSLGQSHRYNGHQIRVGTALPPSEVPRAKNDSEVPHVDDDSMPLSVFMLLQGLPHCLWWRLTDI